MSIQGPQDEQIFPPGHEGSRAGLRGYPVKTSRDYNIFAGRSDLVRLDLGENATYYCSADALQHFLASRGVSNVAGLSQEEITRCVQAIEQERERRGEEREETDLSVEGVYEALTEPQIAGEHGLAPPELMSLVLRIQQLAVGYRSHKEVEGLPLTVLIASNGHERTFEMFLKDAHLGSGTSKVAKASLRVIEQSGLADVQRGVRLVFKSSDPAAIASFRAEYVWAQQLKGYPDLFETYGMLVSYISGTKHVERCVALGPRLTMLPPDKAWSTDDLVAIARGLARGADVLHTVLGLVHGDLKFGNIYLEFDATGAVLHAKLGDWGMAEAAARGAVWHGTPAYAPLNPLMAPSTPKQNEMWAHGMVLYGLLLQQRPPWYDGMQGGVVWESTAQGWHDGGMKRLQQAEQLAIQAGDERRAALCRIAGDLLKRNPTERLDAKGYHDALRSL